MSKKRISPKQLDTEFKQLKQFQQTNKNQSTQMDNNNQSTALHKALKEEGGYKFAVNKWGSCQYSGALAVYNLVTMRLEKYGNDVNKALEIFGVSTIPTPQSNPDYDFRESILRVIKEQAENFIDCEDIYRELLELYVEYKNNQSMNTLDRCFQVARNCSYDLWAAVDTFIWIPVQVLQHTPINLQLEQGLPVLNQVLQEENLRTGICCALMVHYGYIQNPDEAFANFDT